MEAQDRQIGEHTYRVTPFGAKRAMKVLDRIKVAAASGLESAIVGVSTGNPALMAGIITKLNFSELYAIGEEFGDSTKVMQGDARVPVPLGKMFDQHFACRLDELAEFVVFAFLVNFESSIARGKDCAARIGEMTSHLMPTEAELASLTTSTGPSSGSSPAGGTT